MTKYLAQSYVDHFLQAEIMRKLASAEGPVRFSGLKEDGIENSLFMYHANKLIDRGLISKLSQGFSLTVKGARWANFVDLDNMGRVLPRPLVQLIIRNNAGALLIATRKGQFKELLNAVMLPGGLHTYGMPADEVAAEIVERLFGSHTKPTFLSVVEAIHTSDDDFVYHTVSHLFEVQLDQPALPARKELFTYSWLPLDEVTSDNALFADSELIPRLIAKLPHLQSHGVFRLKSK
jgi:hypothetical protein